MSKNTSIEQRARDFVIESIELFEGCGDIDHYADYIAEILEEQHKITCDECIKVCKDEMLVPIDAEIAEQHISNIKVV